MATETNCFIGQRVLVTDDIYGTVAYIGPIPGSSGIWLGVDWDDAQRGRHDGVYNGVKYFQTHHPTSGSFVRPSKIFTGIGLLEAINSRYCQGLKQLEESKKMGLIIAPAKQHLLNTNNNSVGETTNSTALSKSTTNPPNHGFSIELIGFDRLTEEASKLNVLQAVLLHSMPLAFCSEEDANQARQLLLSSTSMNVAQTLLSDWSTVARICTSVHHLTELTVSNNCLRLPIVKSAEDSQNMSVEDQLKYHIVDDMEMEYLKNVAFSSVLHLVAVRMRYTWNHFIAIFPWFPRVQIVILAHNDISSLPGALHVFPSCLTHLDLIGNTFDSARSCQDLIDDLSQLPCLDTLLLNECEFTDFTLAEANDQYPVFPMLKRLCLMGNRISSWTTINHLNRLPNLIEISLLNNPLMKMCPDDATARQGIIARLGKLQLLNRATIIKDERRGAELDYIKLYGEEWLKLQTPQSDSTLSPVMIERQRSDFAQTHPRFEFLIKKYGAPELSELKQVSQALKNSLLAVTVECPTRVTRQNKSSIEMKLPSRMIVQHLQALLRRQFTIPNNQPIRLTYASKTETGERSKVEYDIDAATREIGFYNLSSGDTIIIHLT